MSKKYYRNKSVKKEKEERQSVPNKGDKKGEKICVKEEKESKLNERQKKKKEHMTKTESYTIDTGRHTRITKENRKDEEN